MFHFTRKHTAIRFPAFSSARQTFI